MQRFQQTTPAIMAKGVEDTAFYRYGRLLALNDVGGDPSRFSLPVDAFHAANLARPPANLLITQTHDTKRSGDVRARLGALAGMAEEWAGHVRRWFEACSPLRGPDAAERYFIFQTLIGAWPIELDRLEAYMEKALREAKRNTNWIEPDTAYEDRVKAFCRSAVRAPPVPHRLRAVRRGGRARRRAGRARPAAAQADRPGRARHLPGRRAARRSRSSIPTTAGRSTGCAAARCSPRSPAARPRPPRRASCG